jgi:hypothetical protein
MRERTFSGVCRGKIFRRNESQCLLLYENGVFTFIRNNYRMSGKTGAVLS